MPYSSEENHKDAKNFVKDFGIKKVLDVGAGSGTYGRLLRPLVERIDAVEIWEPYVEQFALKSVYDIVIIDDIRKWTDYTISGRHWDLIIFGDVLEHMTSAEAKRVWQYASYIANYGIISVPIIHYPQGAEFNNPYEVHVQEHINVEELKSDFGPFIVEKQYDITGMFIKEFKTGVSS